MTHAAPAIDRAESTTAPTIALVVGALALGISPIFVRMAEVGPFASAFWRVLLALPALYLWMRLSETGRSPRRELHPAGRLRPACCSARTSSSWHLAIRATTVANATFFATTAPLWVVLFGWLLFRQGVSRLVLAGLALCLAGGAAIVAQSLAVDLARVPGDLAGAATGVMFGLYFLAVGAARRTAGAARVTFELSVITAAVLFVVAVVAEGDIRPPTPHAWLVLVALALVSHAGGQGLLSVALGRLPPVFSSLVIFLEAVAAALFAWLFLGEAVTPPQAFGGALILLGIWVARPRRVAA